jgi:hypothetical protein
MRLYPGRIASISSEVVRLLRDGGDIETESPKDVEADLTSVLQTYLDTEREVTEQAKEIMQSRGLPQTEFNRTKRLVAEQKRIGIGDEVLDYLLDQLVEMLLHSGAVDEVFSQDVDLRRKMVPILRKHMEVDEEVDRETRARIKHVEEGSRTWEIEYRRVMEDIRRRKGL